MFSMFENCDYFLFDDVTLSKMSEAVSDLIPGNFIFHAWRTFQFENINDFWAVGKGSNVVGTVLCWHKKIALGLLAAYA